MNMNLQKIIENARITLRYFQEEAVNLKFDSSIPLEATILQYHSMPQNQGEIQYIHQRRNSPRAISSAAAQPLDRSTKAAVHERY